MKMQDRSGDLVFAIFIVVLLALGVTAGFVNQYHNAKAHRPCAEVPDAE